MQLQPVKARHIEFPFHFRTTSRAHASHLWSKQPRGFLGTRKVDKRPAFRPARQTPRMHVTGALKEHRDGTRTFPLGRNQSAVQDQRDKTPHATLEMFIQVNAPSGPGEPPRDGHQWGGAVKTGAAPSINTLNHWTNRGKQDERVCESVIPAPLCVIADPHKQAKTFPTASVPSGRLH